MNLIDYKVIKQFKGKYLVSSLGEIVSIDKNGKVKKLKPHKHRNGHLRIKIKGKNYPVHRLVIETWRGKAPSKKHVCRHLNDIHCDNRLQNLVWGTVKENSKDVIDNTIKRIGVITKMRDMGFSEDEISILARIPLLELEKIR
jgi:hypothetical protein